MKTVPPKHSGREFVFGIPENGYLSSIEPQILIYTINPNSESVDADIFLPNMVNVAPFPVKATILPYSRHVCMVQQSKLAPSGSSLNDRAVKITASLDVIVQVSNNGYLTTDGFMVYPVESLDTRYSPNGTKSIYTILHLFITYCNLTTKRGLCHLCVTL